MIQYKWQASTPQSLSTIGGLTSQRDLGKKITASEYEKACKEQEIFGTWINDVVLADRSIILVPNGDTGLSLRHVPTQPKDARRWQGFGLKNTTLTALAGLPAVSFPGKKYISISTRTFEAIDLGCDSMTSLKSIFELFENTHNQRAIDDAHLFIYGFNKTNSQHPVVGKSVYFSEATNKEQQQPISMLLIGPQGKCHSVRLILNDPSAYVPFSGSDLWLTDFLQRILENTGVPWEVRAGSIM
jgi:hypothetical protein